MRHALTNTAACVTADAMALEKAKLGDGSKVIELRRKAWDSYDLAYVVEGVNGTRKDASTLGRVVVRSVELYVAPMER